MKSGKALPNRRVKILQISHVPATNTWHPRRCMISCTGELRGWFLACEKNRCKMGHLSCTTPCVCSCADSLFVCAHNVADCCHEAILFCNVNYRAVEQKVVETPMIVEYERPQVKAGRFLRSYRAEGLSGYFLRHSAACLLMPTISARIHDLRACVPCIVLLHARSGVIYVFESTRAFSHCARLCCVRVLSTDAIDMAGPELLEYVCRCLPCWIFERFNAAASRWLAWPTIRRHIRTKSASVRADSAASTTIRLCGPTCWLRRLTAQAVNVRATHLWT